MVERFYSIGHLTTAQLREMYTTYRKQGWTDSEYFVQNPAGAYPPELSEADIILNIDADEEENYFVFMLDHEDEDDGVMISFSMSYHDFAVFLHLPPELLDEMVEKYALRDFKEGEKYNRWEEFLAKEGLKYSVN